MVESAKLLGVIISSDLKWNEHTEYIVKKSKRRLWYLWRLSSLGASRDTLMNQYRLIVRSLMETSVPVFSGGLPKTNIDDIEAVQKGVFKIILWGKYKNYENALSLLHEKTLQERRQTISLKFAKKCPNHPKMKHWFEIKQNLRTRRGNKFVETKFKTARGNKEPVNYLIRLLNSNPNM